MVPSLPVHPVGVWVGARVPGNVTRGDRRGFRRWSRVVEEERPGPRGTVPLYRTDGSVRGKYDSVDLELEWFWRDI